MAIYITRHGETDWNKRRVLQGTADIPLNEHGRKQAEALHHQLVEQGLQFTRIYCSPLDRAIETAVIATGVSREDLILDPRLREIEFGVLEGSRYELENPEIAAALPEQLSNFGLDPGRFVPAEGGESLQDVIRRTGSFWKDVLKTVSPEEKILIVSHGCALHALLFNVMQKSDFKEYWSPLFGNCELAEIRNTGIVPVLGS